MVGTFSSGNPNIIEDTKGKQTGPKSEIGKLKCSLNTTKYTGTSSRLNAQGDSKITTMMKRAGLDFSKVEDAIEKRNLFTIWLKSKSTEELTEIQKLDTVIQLLESDVAMRTMRKLEKGIALSDKDVRIIKLLKETLETAHKLKFGDKHLHAHVGYDDIRKMMFDDNS